MKMIPLGVALIPDKATILQLCKMNSEIRRTYPSGFVLKSKESMLPHLSLFQGVYPEKRMAAAAGAALWAASGQRFRVVGKPSGVTLWARKIFFLDLEKTEELFRMHKRLVGKLFPLRGKSVRLADPQRFIGIGKRERDSIRRYAYPFAMGAFRPHFTLGRSEKLRGTERAFAKNLEKAHPMPKRITFERLVVFEVGKYGGFKKEIVGVRLGRRAAKTRAMPSQNA